MTLLQCNVLEGPRPAFKVVEIQSIEGHCEYLTVEERFLVKKGDQHLLPVVVVGKDRVHNTYLVQLPFEADSGANRVWVEKAAVISSQPDEVPA